VKAAADRALRRVREDLNANPPYDNDVPYWPDTVIVHEGTGCWGACRTDPFRRDETAGMVVARCRTWFSSTGCSRSAAWHAGWRI